MLFRSGIPQELHSDGAKALTQGEYSRKTKKYEIRTTQTEPYSSWKNEAERANKIVKKLGGFLMQASNTPLGFGHMHICLLLQFALLLPPQR